MELRAQVLTRENFSRYGTFLDPNNCGEPINPGSKYPYYMDRLPLTFGGGTLITLNVQTIEKRPLEFTATEAHDFTEELVGGFDVDLVFHVGPENNEGPDFSKFEAFLLPKMHWFRLKRGVYHDCPFILAGTRSVGWCILPPFTAWNDSREYQAKSPIRIVV